MRFSTVLMIRHSIVTFFSTDHDETSPAIQMAANKPEAVHIINSGCHAEFHIDFDEITGLSMLHCDGDP